MSFIPSFISPFNPSVSLISFGACLPNIAIPTIIIADANVLANSPAPVAFAPASGLNIVSTCLIKKHAKYITPNLIYTSKKVDIVFINQFFNKSSFLGIILIIIGKGAINSKYTNLTDLTAKSIQKVAKNHSITAPNAIGSNGVYESSPAAIFSPNALYTLKGLASVFMTISFTSENFIFSPSYFPSISSAV